jgi:glutaredoxin-related protein
MKKYFLLIAVVIAAFFVFYYLQTSKTADVNGNESVIFFYGKECPHCQIVEEYITKNKIAGKVKFAQAEVFHNQNNQKVFLEKYKICGVTNENQMGVPMLWADEKCIVGQDKVMEYLQSKAGIVEYKAGAGSSASETANQ